MTISISTSNQNPSETIQAHEQPNYSLDQHSFTIFFSQEEAIRILAAYEKDSEAVTLHRLPLGDWIRGIILDWVSVVERDSSSSKDPVSFPSE